MRRFPDAYSGADVTIQTWQITGVGTIEVPAPRQWR